MAESLQSGNWHFISKSITQINIPIGSYNDPPSSSTRLVNCYIEQGSEQGRGPVLNGAPGISAYREIGNGPIRGATLMRGVKYVVSGNKLFSVDSGVNELGTIPGSSRVQMAGNGIQLAVLVEPDIYIYTLSTGLVTQVTDSDFVANGASSIRFIDNYISYTIPSTGQWAISDLADATSYDSLNFATAEGSPDDLITHVVDHRQAILFGPESFEIWDNAGISGFPFIRASNGFGELGILAKHSAQKVDQSVIWLASDGTVRRLSGITPVRISNHHVERSIQDSTISECFSMTMTWEGHINYILTFPEITWIYDVTSQQWNERKSYGFDNWRVSCAVSADGQSYVGDSESNKFGRLDDVFKEWDEPLVMQWAYQAIESQGARAIHHKLEILMESGTGLPYGQGSDPEVSLDVSDDGKVFRAFPTRKLGQIGEYQKRVQWHRLGSSRYRVYRPSISDPVRRRVVATFAEVEGGQ